MSIRKKIITAAGRLMMSCDKATLLLSRQQHERLSLGSRLHLKLHLLTCHACRNFHKQITILNNGLKGINKKIQKGDTPFKVPPEVKNRMENNLRDRMKE